MEEWEDDTCKHDVRHRQGKACTSPGKGAIGPLLRNCNAEHLLEGMHSYAKVHVHMRSTNTRYGLSSDQNVHGEWELHRGRCKENVGCATKVARTHLAHDHGSGISLKDSAHFALQSGHLHASFSSTILA